eukprot:UN00798
MKRLEEPSFIVRFTFYLTLVFTKIIPLYYISNCTVTPNIFDLDHQQKEKQKASQLLKQRLNHNSCFPSNLITISLIVDMTQIIIRYTVSPLLQWD